ncbi:beta-glucosidase [Umbelopsis sp. AD052]|nr:beta-glucosidase [Umbelopsis sp. AD052]
MKVSAISLAIALSISPFAYATSCSQPQAQCAGVGYYGPNCCTAGHHCVASSAYISTCVSYAEDNAALPRQRIKSPLAVSEIATPVATELPQVSSYILNTNGKWDSAITKARSLVSKMSIEEKVNITTGMGWQEGHCLGNTPPIPRLNFTGLCLQDSPAGIRFTKGISVFPSGINTAATFDKKLIYERAKTLGEEFRAKGVNVALTPMMNLMRSPYAGRNWEGAGEDPFLVGVVASLTVKGIQENGVIATAKHFAGNEQETNRNSYSSYISDRAMHELYMWPFRESVEAGVGSIMCSYNKVNGTYACENDKLINGLLKGELGFRGFVQSDWSATMSTLPSANGGLDMTMPGDIQFHSGDSYYGKNLTKAVVNGLVKESRLNDMAVRVVSTWYMAGQDKDYPETNFDSWDLVPEKFVDVQGTHAQTIRQVSAASVILLRNEQKTLPLQNIQRLGIIGDDAGANAGGPNSCEDRGCDRGTLAIGWGSGTAEFPYLVTPFDGISSRTGKQFKIIPSLDDYDYEYAAKVASEVDVALVFANADSGEEFVTVEENVGDRTHLQLWHNTEKLIKTVADINPRTVVVVHAVGPVDMAWANHPNISAIVWAGLPGQESGNALADVLFGDVNPSGRLPYTIAKTTSDYPVRIEKNKDIKYTEDLRLGYRWFESGHIDPMYEFGYGLSYTQFNYTDATIEKKGHNVAVNVTLQNVGGVDGAEVPQLYLEFPSEAEQPSKILRGFEKVFLKAGQKQTTTFNLDSKLISYWNVQSQKWVVAKGDYIVYLGASSRDIRQKITFTV